MGQGRCQGQTDEVDLVHQENESSLIQPLLECHCQLYQLRELIAKRAASMVSVYELIAKRKAVTRIYFRVVLGDDTA